MDAGLTKTLGNSVSGMNVSRGIHAPEGMQKDVLEIFLIHAEIEETYEALQIGRTRHAISGSRPTMMVSL